MKYFILIIFFSCNFLGPSYSQNLVFNPSFELHDTCPTMQQQIEFALGWKNPLHGPWGGYDPLVGDYYNVCGAGIFSPPAVFVGYQMPKGGDAYVGMYSFGYASSDSLYSREYIQTQLLDTLEAGSSYYVEFSVSRAEYFQHTHSSFGILFTDDSLYFQGQREIIATPSISNLLGNTILDSALWYTVSGIYTAQGNEKYLCLGNFLPNSLVDTVSLSSTPPCICAYEFYDDVVVSKITGIEEEQGPAVHIYPNPATESLTIEGIMNYTNYRIVDAKGSILKKGSIASSTERIDLDGLAKGNYVLVLKSGNNVSSVKFVKQ